MRHNDDNMKSWGLWSYFPTKKAIAPNPNIINGIYHLFKYIFIIADVVFKIGYNDCI